MFAEQTVKMVRQLLIEKLGTMPNEGRFCLLIDDVPFEVIVHKGVVNMLIRTDRCVD